MRLLFDESLPHLIQDEFEAHLGSDDTAAFVQDLGWQGLDNGALLRNAQDDFDLLITADTSILEHTNLDRYEMSILILHGPTNRLEDLTPLVPEAVQICGDLEPHEHRIIRHPDLTE